MNLFCEWIWRVLVLVTLISIDNQIGMSSRWKR
jgi:hypothetical protein